MTGMLWFDNDPKSTLLDKLDRAADYYEKKYGRRPDFCEINLQKTNEEMPSKHNEIVILSSKEIPKNYFFLGVHE